eukprot:COSAG01_NODE_1280_length_10925_cov_23.969333_18_plen_96_part_00
MFYSSPPTRGGNASRLLAGRQFCCAKLTPCRRNDISQVANTYMTYTYICIHAGSTSKYVTSGFLSFKIVRSQINSTHVLLMESINHFCARCELVG